MLRLPEFDYQAPREVAEAVTLLALHGREAKVLAGGTDLLPSLKQHLFGPKVLVSLAQVSSLRKITETADGGLSVGAMATLAEVARHPLVRSRHPALADACATIATVLIQNFGTLGGNVLLDTRCYYYNQSEFWRTALGGCMKKDGDVCHVARSSPTCLATHSADTVPSLILLNASLRLVSAQGERVVPVASLYTDDGKDFLRLAPGELLTEILLPPVPPHSRVVHRKMRRRQAIDYGFLLLALRVDGSVSDGMESARAVLSCVGPRPVEIDLSDLARGRALSEEVAEEMAHRAAKAVAPLTTHGVQPSYRKKMAKVMVRRALDDLRGLPLSPSS